MGFACSSSTGFMDCSGRDTPEYLRGGRLLIVKRRIHFYFLDPRDPNISGPAEFHVSHFGRHSQERREFMRLRDKYLARLDCKEDGPHRMKAPVIERSANMIEFKSRAGKVAR
jgi:hypothetical protein